MSTATAIKEQAEETAEVRVLDGAVQVRNIDDDNMEVDIIASTPKKDAHGTKLDQDGWILDRFKKNPVILYGHEDRPAPLFGGPSHNAGLPIARAIVKTIRVEDNKLKMRIRFTDEKENPFGIQVFNMIKGGFLNTVSVGFRVSKRETHEDEDTGETTIIFKEMELMEVSVVTIPSNDAAVIERCAEKLNREPEEIKKAICTIEDEMRNLDKEELKKYVKKCVDYFEQKQPVNKISGKVMKLFYSQREIDIPEEEVTAWRKMRELMEDEEAEDSSGCTTCGGGINECKDCVVEKEKETGKEPEEKASKAVSEETPPEEQKNSVHLTPIQLQEVRKRIVADLEETAREAHRQGVPAEDIPKVVDTRKRELLKDPSSLFV